MSAVVVERDHADPLDELDEPEQEPLEHVRRKRARTAIAPPHGVSLVRFSPAEWRSFQRSAHALLAASAPANAAASASSSSASAGLAAELAAAIASQSHEKHAVFDSAVIHKVLYSSGADCVVCCVCDAVGGWLIGVFPFVSFFFLLLLSR